MNLDALIDGRVVCPDELLGSVRAAAAELRERLDAVGPAATDALVRQMIVEGVPEAQALAVDTGVPTDELCERAIALRGGLEGGVERTAMRERARLHLRLARGKVEPPHDAGDLLALWDEATRGEPLIRLRVSEPRLRDGADGLPFTGTDRAAIFGAMPLTPGNETADPEDIPRLLGRFLAFCGRCDLAPELVAARSLLILWKIHPFVDGNGHTGRLLTCEALARAGYPEPMLLAYLGEMRAHRDEICETVRSVTLGRLGATAHDELMLRLLLGADPYGSQHESH